MTNFTPLKSSRPMTPLILKATDLECPLWVKSRQTRMTAERQ